MIARPRLERFTIVLAVVVLVGLAVRLRYVFGRRDMEVWGDAYFYHHGARLLVEGKGFIAPLQYEYAGVTVQAAEHPPLYLLFLAVPSAFGWVSAFTHMVWSTLLGTATVAVTGLLGRRVAGPRAGLIAAALAAITPNVWVYDGTLLSETLAIFLTTTAVLLAYRAWDEPTVRHMAALGGACGLAALARSELVLFVPALVWPVAIRARTLGRDGAPAPRPLALRRLGAATAAAIVVLAPWVVYNLTRFEHPVLLSSQLEATLAGANCEDTYAGEFVGGLTTTCMYGLDPNEDQSVTARILRARVRRFVGDNVERVPVVMAARVGRVLGVFRPAKQINVDVALEGRDRRLAWVMLGWSYVVTIGAVAGAVILRRRGRAVFPLLVPLATVLVTVAVTYGTNRFRATGETCLVVLAAVAVDALWRRASKGPGGPVPATGAG